MSRIITIVARSSNDFDIHEGERYTPRLCWDEMLGAIAELTHPSLSRSRYGMMTPEEWAEREEHMKRWRDIRRWREDAGNV